MVWRCANLWRWFDLMSCPRDLRTWTWLDIWPFSLLWHFRLFYFSGCSQTKKFLPTLLEISFSSNFFDALIWLDVLENVGVTSDFRSSQILFSQRVRLDRYSKEERRDWTEIVFHTLTQFCFEVWGCVDVSPWTCGLFTEKLNPLDFRASLRLCLGCQYFKLVEEVFLFPKLLLKHTRRRRCLVLLDEKKDWLDVFISPLIDSRLSSSHSGRCFGHSSRFSPGLLRSRFSGTGEPSLVWV